MTTERIDVLAVMDNFIDPESAPHQPHDLREARAAVAELIEGPVSTKARLEHLLASLQFDEKLYGSKPERSTLDFPHAIRIVEQAIAALARVQGGQP